MEKSLSSAWLATDWDLFFMFRLWSVMVEFPVLSFVSARNVASCFEFRSRKGDISASSNVAGFKFSFEGQSNLNITFPRARSFT